MVKIIRILYFTGGMAQERGRKLISLDTAAVIRHADEFNAAFLCLHRDCCRSGINGILHQFLYHTGWSLHHLTGSDPVDRPGVQYMYSHKSPPLCFLAVPAVL